MFLQAITVRWVQHPSQTGSSGESSSSESEMNISSSHHTRVLDSIDTIAENALPSVVIEKLDINKIIFFLLLLFRYFLINMNIINFLLKYPI